MKLRSYPQQDSRQPHPSSTPPSLPAILSKQSPRGGPAGALSEDVSAFDESNTLVAITLPDTHVTRRPSSLHEVAEATVSSSACDTPLIPGYYPPDTANPTGTSLPPSSHTYAAPQASIFLHGRLLKGSRTATSTGSFPLAIS